MSSNVGQSYPYSSEREDARAQAVATIVEAHAELAATIASLVAAREDLAGKLKAETSPLDANERWWVWKCPTKGCPGLLHVAGYAFEKHGLYVVCDGTCAKTFLR